MRMQVLSLALFSGLRVGCCRELGCRSKTRLGSGVAVAVAWAGNCSSDSTPSLGTSICGWCVPKKGKKKKKSFDGEENEQGLLTGHMCTGSEM